MGIFLRRQTVPSEVNYDTMTQSDYVIVLGAGPSARVNMDRIVEWQKTYNAVVIASNYKFRIHADYTAFVSAKKFNENKNHATGKFIVSSPYIKRGHYRKIVKRILVFRSTRIKPWAISRMEISDRGQVGHDLASAGYAAILAASFCRPKHVLLVGFDGMKRKGKFFILRHFNGKTRKNNNIKEMKLLDVRLRNYFANMLIPYLQNNGSTLYAYHNDQFRGLDPESLGVKVIPRGEIFV